MPAYHLWIYTRCSAAPAMAEADPGDGEPLVCSTDHLLTAAKSTLSSGIPVFRSKLWTPATCGRPKTLGRSRIRARLIFHRLNPAIAKTRNLSQYGANSEASSTPTEPSMAQKDAVNAEGYPQRYTSTGIFECVSTLTVSLPRTTAETPRRPCDAITIKSHLLAEAASMIAS